MQQELTDYGVVERTFEVQEGDAGEIAREINLYEGKHGEYY